MHLTFIVLLFGVTTEDDEEILTGSNCSHMFHKQCAMVWLTNFKKPKDHCPYCRKEMVTPEQMKTAAMDVLGEERVRELTEVQRTNTIAVAAADNLINNTESNVIDVELPEVEENEIIRDV